MPFRVILNRWECNYLAKNSSKWLLVYGRRKTGKTWLLRHCIERSLYATITRSGECILEERDTTGYRVVGLGECIDTITKRLRRGSGSIVIDEFQRLPTRYWDLIALTGQEAEAGLIACGSSLGIAARIFDRHSPLLGLFEAFRVDLVDIADAIASLHDWGLPGREAVLWSVVARDPWLLMHVEPRGEPWRVLAQHARGLVPAARGLVGEVFVEEERQLSRVYDATLRLLAEGYWRASDIAARLYAAGLVSSPQPGSATGVLGVLEEMGLVERIPLWRTRGARTYYRHRSPLVSLLYQVADSVEELGVAPSPEALRTRYGLELQFTIGELLARRRASRRAYSIQPGGRDVDVVLLERRGHAVWGYEVKMGSIATSEAESIAAWMRSIGIPRAGVVALGGVSGVALGLDEVLDAEALVEEARRIRRGTRDRM